MNKAPQTVGIDLGTSYSAVAQLDSEGNPLVLRNSNGSYVTASVVLLGRGQKIYVDPSHSLRSYPAEHIVTGIKRKMGDPNYYLLYEGRRLNAEFISGLILRRLKLDAEPQIGPIANAVITVPYYFNDICRRATINAGRIAGLNVLDLLNEPTAAVLTYAWMHGELGGADSNSREKTVLVYDLGGGTFDVTVVRYSPTNFQVLVTDGDTFLGGLDWTERIISYAAEKFWRKYGFDPRAFPLDLADLKSECDFAKMELSQRPQTVIPVTSQGKTLMVGLGRQEFERMTADLLQRTLDTTELVLEQSGVSPAQLDDILLVGGSTYMPGVLFMLERLCGKPPSRVLAPQLAVAQGAAIHAAILDARQSSGRSALSKSLLERLTRVQTHDVNSHSLGVEISEPGTEVTRNHIMIPRNHPLPFSVKQRFVTTKANPNGIRIRLLEGETGDLSGCAFIGECRISGLPPNLPIGSPVEVTYSYDANRLIRVTARELTGNTSASVELAQQGELSDEVLRSFQNLATNYRAE